MIRRVRFFFLYSTFMLLVSACVGGEEEDRGYRLIHEALNLEAQRTDARKYLLFEVYPEGLVGQISHLKGLCIFSDLEYVEDLELADVQVAIFSSTQKDVFSDGFESDLIGAYPLVSEDWVVIDSLLGVFFELESELGSSPTLASHDVWRITYFDGQLVRSELLYRPALISRSAWAEFHSIEFSEEEFQRRFYIASTLDYMRYSIRESSSISRFLHFPRLSGTERPRGSDVEIKHP